MQIVEYTWLTRHRVGFWLMLVGVLGLGCLGFTTFGCAGKPLVVGKMDDGSMLVPTGQYISPAGATVAFHGRPVDLLVLPDASTVVVKDNRGLVILDAVEWGIVRQELPFGNSLGGSMHGLAWSEQRGAVYATTAQDVLMEGHVLPDGRFDWTRQISLPGPDGKGPSHGTGIAITNDARYAYVCLSLNNAVVRVDLDTGQVDRTIPVGVAPYDILLSADGRRAYVSNWGGRRVRPGDITASSGGTSVVVDERGIGASGTVSVLDLESASETAQVVVDLHPCALALTPDGNTLFVANANSDTVSVIDTRAWTVAQTVKVKSHPDLPFGSAPNALALMPKEDALLVALGGDNALAILALEPGDIRKVAKTEGFIPTGWFPGAVVTKDEKVYTASVKGLGSRLKDKDDSKRREWDVKDFAGCVSRVTMPTPQELEAFSRRVRDAGGALAAVRAANPARERSQTTRGTLPADVQHVFYIIKENRTYDQVLGDLPQGNGDPSLCVFDREVTPNHHALAEQFVLLDNYYCNGVVSADGHSWATEGNVTDHLEKSFGGFTRSYTWGDDPLTYSSSGFIWDNVLAHGLTFRNYGEMDYTETVPENATFIQVLSAFQGMGSPVTFTHTIGIERLARYSSPDYPGWNMRIPDVVRADVFLKELAQGERDGQWPNFTIIFLPQDHGSGTKPGLPTPRAHMADNDLALGQIVEGITRSRFWSTSCIFVNEDDPQGGFDHVDGHRSICLVISPYTQHGRVVSTFYNQTAVLHTMARLLGIPPMNRMDAMAPLMTDCFQREKNVRPYTAQSNEIPLDELNPPTTALRGRARDLAMKSAAMDFEGVDRIEEDTMNRAIWHSVRGEHAPYPAHLAGPHGTGLARLGLTLGGEGESDD